MHRGNRDQKRKFFQNQEYEFKQTHSGREPFQGGEWGASSEFGQNSPYRESDSSDRKRASYQQGKFSPVEKREGERSEIFRNDSQRSRLSEPYTGGQFARSQYGLGTHYAQDWGAASDFTGLGPRGYRRSDERIREDVCDALYRSPLVDARDVEVTVSEGVVKLEGSCEDRLSKREAEICIEFVPGVKDVINEIQLRKLA